MTSKDWNEFTIKRNLTNLVFKCYNETTNTICRKDLEELKVVGLVKYESRDVLNSRADKRWIVEDFIQEILKINGFSNFAWNYFYKQNKVICL